MTGIRRLAASRPTEEIPIFAHLAVHSRIVVTGPQRSGTTIAAQMIAHDTGHRYVDEREFGSISVSAWRRKLEDEHIVVQCPHMLKAILDDPLPEVLVVLMRRPLDEIYASQDRIGWDSRFGGNTQELAVFGRTEGSSAELKYEYWDMSPKPPNYLELDYGSLRDHPLYVAQEMRADFDPKQTTV